MSGYQPPSTITIPTPMIIVRQRGIHATGERYRRAIKLRVSLSDRLLIERVCTEMDMPMSNFIRWCSVHTAAQLQRDIDEIRGTYTDIHLPPTQETSEDSTE